MKFNPKSSLVLLGAMSLSAIGWVASIQPVMAQPVPPHPDEFPEVVYPHGYPPVIRSRRSDRRPVFPDRDRRPPVPIAVDEDWRDEIRDRVRDREEWEDIENDEIRELIRERLDRN